MTQAQARPSGTIIGRILRGAIVFGAASSPVLVGVISIRSAFFKVAVPIAFVLALFLGSGPVLKARWPLATNVALGLVSASLLVAVLDLVTRPLLGDQLYYRPDERFLQRWPPMPLVSRYTPNVSYVGRAYGDLAASSGVAAYRAYREIAFQTDAYGFRNIDDTPGTVDVIVLGDSFGAGTGITQDEAWASILAERYGLSVYNLSTPGSPWQEYVNFALEIERLETHENTVVLWMLFTGNDLEGDYHPIYDVSTLPWNDTLRAWVVSYQTFRFRSPVRQNLNRLHAARTENPIIVETLPIGQPMLFYAPYEQRRQRTPDELRAKGEFERFEDTITAMQALTEAHGVTLVMLLAPSKEEVYGWLLEGAKPWSGDEEPSGFSVVLKEIAAREGILYLDLKPSLVEAAEEAFEDSGALLWWTDDSHWSPAGHETVAGIVHDTLCLGFASEPICCAC